MKTIRIISVMLALAGMLAAGCQDSRSREQTAGTTAGAEKTDETRQAPAAPSVPAPPADAASTPRFHPVLLDEFYQRRFVDYRPTDSWAQVPSGETNFDGVPFLMFGKIDLTGLGRARDGEFQPPRVGEIPVARRATRLHVIHGASYDSPDGTPVACVLLRYATGETRKLFLSYGVHTRNWYVEAREADPTLSDPRSLVVWNGSSRPNGAGTPTRLFKTTFDNPLPAQEIRTLELLSLFARANVVILAITLEESPVAATPPALAQTTDNDDSELRREDFAPVLDAETGQPIPSATVKLSVIEGARTYRFGVYESDARGQIRIIYPPGRFNTFIVDLSAPGYSPEHFEILSDDGILGSSLPVRLKRQPPP
jgi:hypothetical protein